MKLIINIPEDAYNYIKANGARIPYYKLTDAIKNGIPLPEGHGRLIDADKAIQTLKSLGNRDYRREKGTIQEAEKMLSSDEYAPTIIEAESEDKE